MPVASQRRRNSLAFGVSTTLSMPLKSRGLGSWNFCSAQNSHAPIYLNCTYYGLPCWQFRLKTLAVHPKKSNPWSKSINFQAGIFLQKIKSGHSDPPYPTLPHIYMPCCSRMATSSPSASKTTGRPGVRNVTSQLRFQKHLRHPIHLRLKIRKQMLAPCIAASSQRYRAAWSTVSSLPRPQPMTKACSLLSMPFTFHALDSQDIWQAEPEFWAQAPSKTTIE